MDEGGTLKAKACQGQARCSGAARCSTGGWGKLLEVLMCAHTPLHSAHRPIAPLRTTATVSEWTRMHSLQSLRMQVHKRTAGVWGL